MKKYKLKAYCKINLSLRVLKKLKNGYHKIQSFMTFADVYDEIYIKEIKENKDKINFLGKFKNRINIKYNTITKTLKTLRKEKKLTNKFFEIKIKKNIPSGAGLGGGSSDAAALINFLNLKMKLKLNRKALFRISSKIGSDVFCSMIRKNLYILGKKILIFKSKKKFCVLIIYPNIHCSTKTIYLKNKQFSQSHLITSKDIQSKNKIISFLKNEQNDLQEIVEQRHPVIRKVIQKISAQKGCYFSRLTGSGSACIGLFSNMKSASKAQKIIKRKFPKFWYSTSKTI
jgi:4-diphosphocytidyl-2-C-methyl-D-erythritol kinase